MVSYRNYQKIRKDHNKKYRKNSLIIILILVIFCLSTFNIIGTIVYNYNIAISGAAVGSASLVITGESAPVLTTIGNLSGIVGKEFTKTIVATDNDGDTITYEENTSLFEINNTSGLISFTPNSSQIGEHTINFTASDGALNDSEEVVFSIVANSCGDAFCGGNESCSSCAADCGSCSDSGSGSPSGGGGGSSDNGDNAGLDAPDSPAIGDSETPKEGDTSIKPPPTGDAIVGGAFLDSALGIFPAPAPPGAQGIAEQAGFFTPSGDAIFKGDRGVFFSKPIVLSGQMFSTDIRTKVNFDSIVSEKPVVFKVAAKKVSIDAIFFELKEEVSNVKMDVQIQEKFPESVGEFKESKADGVEKAFYQRIKIDTGGSINNENLDRTEIGFNVEKKWLDETNVDETKVAMYRFVDGEWTELVTYLVGENSGEYSYIAQTPGFSYFLIAETENEISKITDETQTQRCISNYSCSDWEPETCGIGDLRTRSCNDINKCTSDAIEEAEYCLDNPGEASETISNYEIVLDDGTKCDTDFICSKWDPLSCNIEQGDLIQRRRCIDRNLCVDIVIYESEECFDGAFIKAGLIDRIKNIVGIAYGFTAFKDNSIFSYFVLIFVLILMSPLFYEKYTNRISKDKEKQLSMIFATIDGTLLEFETAVRTNKKGTVLEIDEKWISNANDKYLLNENRGRF